ncbi:MAG: TetR/AcrR family transcriptional regulator [Methylocystaceae bacterium]
MSLRRDAEREARINLIAEAAIRLFTASSYEEVTMDDIAREADFGKATLYHYFESKDSLLLFIINRALSKLCQQIEIQCLPQEDVVAGLSNYIELRYQYYNDCFPLLLYILRRQLEGQTLEQPGFVKLRELRAQKNQMVGELLERGIAAGVFIPAGSGNLLRVVDSLIRGFIWIKMEHSEPTTDYISDKELIEKVLAGGILACQINS